MKQLILIVNNSKLYQALLLLTQTCDFQVWSEEEAFNNLDLLSNVSKTAANLQKDTADSSIYIYINWQMSPRLSDIITLDQVVLDDKLAATYTLYLDETDLNRVNARALILEERNCYTRLKQAYPQTCAYLEIKSVSLVQAIHAVNDFSLDFKERTADLVSLANTPKAIYQNFNKNGLMLDCSRNLVANLKTLKELLVYQARLGLNWFMLYLEDVYEIKEQPYFGHLRGRYSLAELKEIVAFSEILGIEVIPCIQTLAHLNQFFYWEHEENKYRDLADVLNVKRPAVQALLRQMIASLASVFKTKSIHIGMDEAYDLGRGTYLDEFGYAKKTAIMNEHLIFMRDLCLSYGFEDIMIWDDMFFSNYNKEAAQTRDQVKIPEHIALMYWDYYQIDTEHYLKSFQLRREICDDVRFAGGAWRWTGYVPHNQKTYLSNIASLSAALKANVQAVLCTAWADDGAECPIYPVRFGMSLYAYFNQLAPTHQFSESEFTNYLKRVSGVSLNTWLRWQNLDYLSSYADFETARLDVTPSKYLLYQDALLSPFNFYTQKMPLTYTDELIEMAKFFQETQELPQIIAEFYRKLALTLAHKWRLAVTIKEAYQRGDRQLLSQIALEVIPEIVADLGELVELRSIIWYQEAKAEGLEILQLRFGGLQKRLQCVATRLQAYCNGEVNELNELDYPDLDPTPWNPKSCWPATHYNRALRAMSVNRASW